MLRFSHALRGATVALALSAPAYAQQSDAEIRRELIRQSLAGYDGPCPCPYNTMRNGAACNERSAYIKPGGESPLCFDSDVTPAMIRAYRQSRGK